MKKRSDGRFETTVTIGYAANGKPIRKHLYGNTEKEIREKSFALKVEMGKGLDMTVQNDTFEQWANRWLSTKKLDVGHSQYGHYKTYIGYLNGYFANVPIKDIRLMNIQEVINDLYIENPYTEKPSSKKVLTEIKNTAKQIFEYAIDNRVLELNPATKVKIPKNAVKEEKRALTEEEQRIINEMPHKMQTAAMIMLHTGLRRGELIPLKWTDIDLKRSVISVRKAVDLSQNQPIVKSTKTKAGNRDVIIPEILMDYLKKQEKSSELVCPALNGEMYTATSWRVAWNSYLTDMDIVYGKNEKRKSKFDPRFKGISRQRITPHMLRHTFCTNLVQAEVSPSTIQQQMGHASIKTTLDIYTHISESFKQNDLKKYNDYISNVVKCRQDNSQSA